MMLPWIVCPKATRTILQTHANQKPIRQISPCPTPPCHTFAASRFGEHCYRGLLWGHARGRDLPRKSQRITYSAMMWLPQREVKIQKYSQKEMITGTIGSKKNAHVLPRYGNVHLEWKELIRMGTFSPMSRKLCNRHSAANLFIASRYFRHRKSLQAVKN